MVPGFEYVDNLGENKTRYYWVRFVNGKGEAGPYNDKKGTVAVTKVEYPPPPAPTNLEATGGFSNIILSWDENYYPGHAYTEVWAAGETDGGAPAIGNAVPIAMVPGFQFADDVGEDQTRYYWVRFINVEGEAGPYNAVEGTKGHTGIEFETPPSPTDLKAVVDGENVILSWDEDKYHGYAYTEIWSADGTGGKEPALSDASPLFMVPGFEYVDNLGENKTRYYWVRFVNGKGEAGPYNDKKGTVAVTKVEYPPPPAPTNLEATGGFSNIILSWDENYYPGHAYTEVWSAGETDGGAPAIGNAVPIAMVPGFQFADDVGEDQTRYYWVRFINVEGEAGPYNAVEGTKGHTGIEFETPPSPTDLKAVVDGENVILSWDEDKYHGYAYTEIWSADGTGGKEPALSDASPLFMVPGFEYVDNLGENKTRYYWVRFVNGKGEAGPYNDKKGTVAVTKVEYPPPPAPTNLEATGGFSNIILSWDENYYPGHAYTEVWSAGETDDGAPAIGNAVPIAMVPGFQFADDVGEDQTRYYWVRFINVEGEAGPYNAVEGTKGHTGIEFETPPSPTDLKAVVDGENVILSWDEDKYHGYAYTEIWSADGTGGKEPTLSDASPLFMVPGFEYVDNLGENKTRYYWVRFVNVEGEAGRYNAVKGTVAKTVVKYPTPPAPYFLFINGSFSSVIMNWSTPNYLGHDHTEIWASQDQTSVNRAFLVGSSPGNFYVHLSGYARKQYYWVRFVNVEGEAGPYNSVEGTVGEVGEDPDYVLDILDEYVDTIKTDSEGTITGYGGTAQKKPSHKMVIAVDTFALKAANMASKAPFIVQTKEITIGGETVPPGVYIDEAFIRDGSISRAKIGDAAIDTARRLPMLRL